MEELQVQNTIGKIADKINAKRRAELLSLMDFDNPVFKYLADLRMKQTFKDGSKDKTYRKIASLPYEVDIFFSRVYGSDYYKDPDFFTKKYQEWAVIDRRDL